MKLRNYDQEAKDHPDHQYGYNFDHIMHQFMMRTFLNVKPAGKALELGCYHGAFTQLLQEKFSDLTAIEASGDCIAIAKSKTRPTIKFLHTTFEDAELTEKYDAIFLMHTLEHIDDHVALLSKIKGWLSQSGQLFIASPNAHAPSRQIAVKMGLLSHNTCVTPAEKVHGHTITYTLDTLERDARQAGLTITQRGGIFFKGLANFQIDKALAAGIINDQYLEGCYQLGMIYPDLCSSIYIVCSI